MRPNLHRLLLPLIFLIARLAAADTHQFIGQAADVVQIDSITVADTWAAGDVANVTIGNATLTVTMGDDTTTTATIATVLANAINALTIDQNRVGEEIRSAAGQLLPEFRDVEAVIDPGNTSRVLVRSKVAGQPFYDAADSSAPLTLGVSETTAGDGTLAVASVQAATGREWWNNAANWTGGAVPADGDDIVLAETNVGLKYGLPATADEFAPDSITIDQSFAGWLGLPALNTTNTLAYREYRPTAPDLRDDGTNDNTLAVVVGRGVGPGSSLVNLKTTMVHANSSASYKILNSGAPLQGSYAVCLVYDANGTGADIAISGGAVHLKTVEINSVTVNALEGVRAPSVLFDDGVAVAGGGGGITIKGGRVSYRVASSMTVDVFDGELEFVGDVPDALTLYGGRARVIDAGGGTIGTVVVSGAGALDLSPATGAVTFTNCDLFRGATLLDPLYKANYSNGIDLNQCGLEDVTLRLGQHRRLTPSTVP